MVKDMRTLMATIVVLTILGLLHTVIESTPTQNHCKVVLEPVFASEGVEVNINISVDEEVYKDTLILKEGREPREYGFAVFTLQDILTKYWSLFYNRDVEITLITPRDYILVSPIFYRYNLSVTMLDGERIAYSVKVDYFNFSKLVYYEAFVIGLNDTVSVYDGGSFKIIYTNDIPRDFIGTIAEAYVKGIDMLVELLGYSPIQPRLIVFSGPNHHRSYPEGHAHSIGGSTVYMKKFDSRAYGIDWYVKNLYHEVAHGWFKWPILYGDFTVNEGAAEYVSWFLTKKLYPELYVRYDASNIKYRIESGEGYALAAIMHMALNHSLVYISQKYNRTLVDISHYYRYLIDKYMYSGKAVNWNKFIGDDLEGFIAKFIDPSKADDLRDAIAYGIIGLEVRYGGLWDYFDREKLENRIERMLALLAGAQTVTATVTTTSIVTTTVTTTATATTTVTVEKPVTVTTTSTLTVTSTVTTMSTVTSTVTTTKTETTTAIVTTARTVTEMVTTTSMVTTTRTVTETMITTSTATTTVTTSVTVEKPVAVVSPTLITVTSEKYVPSPSLVTVTQPLIQIVTQLQTVERTATVSALILDAQSAVIAAVLVTLGLAIGFIIGRK